jgi:hypothetical protein
MTKRHGTDWIKTSYPQGRCQDCDKLYYSSRGNAKQNLKRLRHHGKQHVYECPTHEGWWHVGHLPEAVVRGEHGREELVQSRRREKGETDGI